MVYIGTLNLILHYAPVKVAEIKDGCASAGNFIWVWNLSLSRKALGWVGLPSEPSPFANKEWTGTLQSVTRDAPGK